jgi:hypothetical protein
MKAAGARKQLDRCLALVAIGPRFKSPAFAPECDPPGTEPRQNAARVGTPIVNVEIEAKKGNSATVDSGVE